jgi:hypothetical protein
MADIFDEIKNSNKYSANNSAKWYRRKLNQLGGKFVTADRTLQDQSRLTNNLVLGQMFLFKYDPKLKAKLPVYDIFPLVIPFNRDSTSFTGLNLHYLSYGSRFALLKKLSYFATDYEESKRVNLSWQLLSNFTKFPEARQCVKKYLYSHVQTRFLYLDYEEWPTAVLLPFEKFVYKT